MRHTPGPWAVREGGKAVWADREYPKGSGVCLLVDPPYHDGVEFPLPEMVIEANARLIAAAPELLEAGRLRRSVIIHDNPDFEGEWVAVPREDFQALRTAIAKATQDE